MRVRKGEGGIRNERTEDGAWKLAVGFLMLDTRYGMLVVFTL